MHTPRCFFHSPLLALCVPWFAGLGAKVIILIHLARLPSLQEPAALPGCTALVRSSTCASHKSLKKKKICRSQHALAWQVLSCSSQLSAAVTAQRGAAGTDRRTDGESEVSRNICKVAVLFLHLISSLFICSVVSCENRMVHTFDCQI